MASRQALVLANWKLNGSMALVEQFKTAFSGKKINAQIGVCTPYVYLAGAAQALRECKIEIGAQSISQYASGAYTGEISADMVTETGASFCLVGHSERRAIFGETDKDCNQKLQAAKQKGLYAVLCVGESQQEREDGQTNTVIEDQLKQALAELDFSEQSLCIAYEPVWAIGTGLSATPKMAQDVHTFIRTKLSELANADAANRISILYGGSVKKDSAKELMAQADIDGLLVGGASLDADHFLAICENAQG